MMIEYADEHGSGDSVEVDAGIGNIILDPARPLHITHLTHGMTLAAVSVAWLRPNDRVAAAVARHLSEQEAAHVADLRTPKRRNEWLAGRLAIKHAVRAYRRQRGETPAPTRDIVVTTVPEGLCAGRPRLDPLIEIGISHSADLAVSVCSASRVGIDLEKNRPLPPTLLNALDTRITSMNPCLNWVCREAILKYFGFGLRADFREIELTEWHSDGLFTWTAGPDLCRRAISIPWPRHGWAAEIAGYSLSLVW